MLARYQSLETKIKNIQKQIDLLPQGKLSCAANGKYHKWYHLTVDGRDYIPKHQSLLTKQLAFKKYLCSLHADLSKEMRAIQFYLDHHPTTSKTEKLLLHPEFSKLLAIEFQPVSSELADWMNEPYERTPHRKYNTFSRLHHTSSENRCFLLLGTFWINGQSHLCPKHLCKTPIILFSRNFSVPQPHHNLRK